MSLSACSDVSAAAWIVDSALPWTQLVAFGPAAFAAYARLRHLPDPTYEGQSENDAGVEGTWWDRDQLAPLLQVLGSHTRTPEDCYVCVWDGYTDNGRDVRIDRSEFPDTRDKVPLWDAGEHPSPNAPQPAPAARPAPYPMVSLSRAPVVVPNRAYFLFHGAIADTYYWGNTEMWAGETRLRPLHPAFVWPADHAWCVASDVDPHWTGIGADTHMIDQLVHDPHLDVVAADPGADQPGYR